MRRRDFFKALSSSIVGCYLALDSAKWKHLLESPLKVNPAWVNAEYEVTFVFQNPRNMIPIIFKRHKDGTVPLKSEDYPDRIILHDEIPMRIDRDNNGQMIFRNPTII